MEEEEGGPGGGSAGEKEQGRIFEEQIEQVPNNCTVLSEVYISVRKPYFPQWGGKSYSHSVKY
jgi:hypothetical protein